MRARLRRPAMVCGYHQYPSVAGKDVPLACFDVGHELARAGIVVELGLHAPRTAWLVVVVVRLH